MNISKKKALRILDEIYQIALNATLTGALREAAGDSMFHTYNKIRDHAIKNAWVEEDLISEVSEKTMSEGKNWLADTGIAAKLLAAMLEDEEVENSKELNEYDENGYKIESISK